MMLSETIEQLAIETRAVRWSPRTIQSYREKLGYLCDFLGDVPIEDVTTSDLRKYVTHLLERNLSRATVRSRVYVLKRLWNFAEAEGIITDNPARQIKIPRQQSKMPKCAEMEDILALLETTQEGTPLDLRDRAAILFLVDTGCRAGELCGLQVDDLDLDAMWASVANMSTRARFVPFAESTREALQKWLDVRPSDRGPWVFVGLATHSKGTLTPSSLYRMLRRRGKVAGCKGPVNPHAFRHAFARHWVMNGGNLDVLAHILGHSSLSMTKSFHDMIKANVGK
jgi:site-specific recombinase XerD